MDFMRPFILRWSGVSGLSQLRLLLLALLFPVVTIAEPLTEARALEVGISQESFTRLLDSQKKMAQGDLISARRWRNPEFEFSWEEVGEESETGVWLRQSIDLSGARQFRFDAAEQYLAATEFANSVQRVERIAQIRHHFYQLLFYQQQRELYNRWIEKFSEVEAAMKTREAAGDVSGYDRRRITRERVSVLSKQRQVEVEYQTARERLTGLVDPQQLLQIDLVSGELTPSEQPPLAKVLQQLEQQPELLRLKHLSQAAHLSARAVKRTVMSDFTIGVGQKSVDGPAGSDSGVMLSASLPLPLFDRRQGEHWRQIAEAERVESEYQLTLQQSQTDLRALWHKASQLNDNSHLFKEESVAASYELVRIAEVAYRASEIGVLELIDAYRSALDAEVTSLELALKARLARIELDKIIEGIQL